MAAAVLVILLLFCGTLLVLVITGMVGLPSSPPEEAHKSSWRDAEARLEAAAAERQLHELDRLAIEAMAEVVQRRRQGKKASP